jgi:hypothetical protein
MLRGGCLCGGIDTRSLALSERPCTVIAQCAVSFTAQLSGQGFRFQSCLSLCSRRGLVDELPLVRGHDKVVLPDMRFIDCELLGP